MKQMGQNGFTLIELVVVLVIIAIGAGLFVPNIGAWLTNYHLRCATRDIVSTMRTAQMKAISNNIQYRVNFNASEVGAVNSFVLQRSIGGVWGNDGAVQTLPPGITVDIDQLAGGRALFNPNATASTGSATLKNAEGAQKKISITPATGRVRIE